ncbi:arabinose efflux permease family protein [Actinoalloteichus sp. GBA129-24]|uniref:Arabinose efflux permease family protein n=1 Tax=Actinoalloteichus fjordicus TaxID=1612552 RepID=A0AAC9LJ02_9PSEU|nr:MULTISPECIES: MFS transporter [Actinoalloteichus]APU17664.1 arabinose efflux permease family protein [Actinoalloteichus fjordicus]APU23741.1 arabinose efflux permease family protein [Actinoalloteichus sp. GBA129-24]
MPAYASDDAGKPANGPHPAEANPTLPPPGRRVRPPRKAGMFASLRVRNYRLYASGQIISLIGTWMQRIAQDWLVLKLSGDSPVALGFAIALQFLPTLALTLWAGVLADRLDKRKILLVVQTGVGLCALGLGLLDLTGVVVLWHVYLFCLLLGCITAVETPARQSFVMEMVGREQVANAVALNSMTFNTARIIGPGVAGYVIAAIGTGWLFVANAASVGAVILVLLLMDTAKLHRSPPVPRGRGQLREGLRYVRSRPDLTVLMALVFLVSTFGMNYNTTLPVMANNFFQTGPEGLGQLSMLMAVGTLSGAALAARRSRNGRPRLRLLLTAGAAFGLLSVVVGLMPEFWSFGLLLIPVGITFMTFNLSANATVQLTVEPTMRGRVMGLYMLVLLGGMPLGSTLSGWLAERVTVPSPIIVGGVISLLASVAGGVVLARVTGVRLRTVLSRRRAGADGGLPTAADVASDRARQADGATTSDAGDVASARATEATAPGGEVAERAPVPDVAMPEVAVPELSVPAEALPGSAKTDCIAAARSDAAESGAVRADAAESAAGECAAAGSVGAECAGTEAAGARDDDADRDADGPAAAALDPHPAGLALASPAGSETGDEDERRRNVRDPFAGKET